MLEAKQLRSNLCEFFFHEAASSQRCVERAPLPSSFPLKRFFLTSGVSIPCDFSFVSWPCFVILAKVDGSVRAPCQATPPPPIYLKCSKMTWALGPPLFFKAVQATLVRILRLHTSAPLPPPSFVRIGSAFFLSGM